MHLITSRKREKTESELRHDVRAKAKASLFYMCYSVCGMSKFTEDLHLPMANYVQMFPWSGGPPNSRRKMCWCSREHFKSSIVSRGLPLWLLAHDRNTTIALVSAKHVNTKKWLRWIANTIEFNETFRWAFPEIAKGLKWDQEEIVVTRDLSVEDVQASVTAYSIKGGLASQHHQHGILDDLLNEQSAYSEIERERACELFDHFDSVLKGEYESTLTLVGTPWPGYDVISHAMETEVDKGTMLHWGIGARGGFQMSEILYEEPYAQLNLVPNVEERLKRDKVIFSEECPESKLQRIKNKNLPQYYYQYLCTRPEDEDNGFNVELIKNYAQMASGELHCDCHENSNVYLNRCVVVGICDPALSQDKRACESAIGVYALDPISGCRYRLYEWGGRVGTMELVDKICSVMREWAPYMQRFAIEDVQFQAALKPWMQERQSQGKAPLHIDVIGVKPKKRDKDLRITAQQPYVNNGLWHKRPDMALEEGTENWLWQLNVWPNQPKKRDRIDEWAYCEDAWEDLGIRRGQQHESSVASMNKARQVRDLQKRRRARTQ
jgi:hypothetical protein